MRVHLESDADPAPTGPAPRYPYDRFRAWFERLARVWPEVDVRLYLVWAVTCTVFVGSIFLSAMLEQTGGEWSAPLDDVFIHFDYARSIARGYPFEWSEGNGFSSGNTSLTYPFTLALGYWVGFRGLTLMQWSAFIAALSLLLFFVAAGRLVSPLGRWAKYIVPPVVLSLGALDWSLISGMENAFHLGVWGLGALAASRAARLADDPRASARAAWLTGAAGALFVLTRPESAVCVFVWGVYLAVVCRKHGYRAILQRLVAVGVPSVVCLGALYIVNRALTGEWSQAGAIAKLAIYSPYMSTEQKWDEWVFHFKYVLLRNLEHHFADQKPYGYLVPLIALIPFARKDLRATAGVLWAQIAGWCVLISLNGQVRWQNERYTMSAVAWLLILAAMGLGTLAARFGETLRGRMWWGARMAVAGIVTLVYWHHQRPNMRDQIWFFARASRNILDQHIRLGERLREEIKPRRILVGDAGALMYASDLPGLDIIGLGGYRDLPFARATRYGLGSSIELIERISIRDRPDFMAIYPSWWGDLPVMFGHYVTEQPVVGNVICGGPSKVVYRADWSALDQKGRPRSLRDHERVIWELDVADIVDEREADYEHPPAAGYVVFRVLPDAGTLGADLFDAGRIIPQGRTESALAEFPASGGRLVVRTIAHTDATVRVYVDDKPIGEIEIARTETWSEPSLDLPAGLPAKGRLTLEAARGEWIDYHAWIVAE